MEGTAGENKRKNFNPFKLKETLACPICRGALNQKGEEMICVDAQHGPFLIDGAHRLHLMAGGDEDKYSKAHQGGINWLKSFLKQYPKLYYFTWNLFCPVLLSGKGPRAVLALLTGHAPIILNLGSGPRRLGEEFINIDVFPFPEVDIVADAAHLPFVDNSVDAVVSESLLEHVPDPHAVVREMTRVLKPGGILYTNTPFLTPYHASPDDFSRWTQSGLRSLFSEFAVIEEGVSAGPWSALLVFLAYWLGVLFSFGSRRLAPVLGVLFMIPLGPLKFLDFLFARIPGSEAVAAQLYFIGKKK